MPAGFALAPANQLNFAGFLLLAGRILWMFNTTV
jgi:hypothetical protein